MKGTLEPPFSRRTTSRREGLALFGPVKRAAAGWGDGRGPGQDSSLGHRRSTYHPHSAHATRTTELGAQGGVPSTASAACGSASEGDSVRSEERRVGKEGRSRWAPYH